MGDGTITMAHQGVGPASVAADGRKQGAESQESGPLVGALNDQGKIQNRQRGVKEVLPLGIGVRIRKQSAQHGCQNQNRTGPKVGPVQVCGSQTGQGSSSQNQPAA